MIKKTVLGLLMIVAVGFTMSSAYAQGNPNNELPTENEAKDGIEDFTKWFFDYLVHQVSVNSQRIIDNKLQIDELWDSLQRAENREQAHLVDFDNHVLDFQSQMTQEIQDRNTGDFLETQARTDADNLLQSRLDQEIQDRDTGDAVLSKEIGDLGDLLTKETQDRNTGDFIEEQSRISGDENLQNQLTQEIQDRDTGDFILQQQIDAIPIQEYSSGFGLISEQNQFSINPSETQQRVNGFCTDGFGIQQINEDGTVICESIPDSSRLVTLNSFDSWYQEDYVPTTSDLDAKIDKEIQDRTSGDINAIDGFRWELDRVICPDGEVMVALANFVGVMAPVCIPIPDAQVPQTLIDQVNANEIKTNDNEALLTDHDARIQTLEASNPDTRTFESFQELYDGSAQLSYTATARCTDANPYLISWSLHQIDYPEVTMNAVHFSSLHTPSHTGPDYLRMDWEFKNTTDGWIQYWSCSNQP